MSERIGVEGVQANGVWGGKIFFRCRWAHPLWFDYFLSICNLDTPLPTGGPAFKKDPRATHQFLIYALDPKQPFDFSQPLTLEAPMPQVLTPANHGYQFVAASHADAWTRVNALVDKCMGGRLSPDTDWRKSWDAHMADGWTLLKSAFEKAT